MTALAAAGGSSAEAGTLGFLVIAGMGVILVFLFRSMTRHLRKVTGTGKGAAAGSRAVAASGAAQGPDAFSVPDAFPGPADGAGFGAGAGPT